MSRNPLPWFYNIMTLLALASRQHSIRCRARASWAALRFHQCFGCQHSRMTLCLMQHVRCTPAQHIHAGKAGLECLPAVLDDRFRRSQHPWKGSVATTRFHDCGPGSHFWPGAPLHDRAISDYLGVQRDAFESTLPDECMLQATVPATWWLRIRFHSWASFRSVSMDPSLQLSRRMLTKVLNGSRFFHSS